MNRTIAKCAGLQTAPNVISGAPEGSYRNLDNCVVRVKDVIESRRGQEMLTYNTAAAINALSHYLGTVIAHSGTDVLSRDTGSALTAYSGSYTPPSPTTLRMKFARSQSRLYFTTDAGVYRLDTVAGTPAKAGVGRPRISWNSCRVMGGGGFLPQDSAVAYRATLTKRDAATREMTSAPSDRAVMRVMPAVESAIAGVVRASNVVTVTTSTAHGFRPGDTVTMSPGEAGFGTTCVVTATPTVTSFKYAETAANASSTLLQTFTLGTSANRTDMVVALPSDAAAGDIFRLWRTLTIVGGGLEPGDEMKLCFEKLLVAADISAGSVTVNDYTPDTMLGDAAYFSPSQETLDAQNEAPPLCRDICTFDSRLWFAYAQPKRQFELTVLATGGSLGVVSGDTLTFALGAGTFTVTAVTDDTCIGTAGKFCVYSGNTGSSIALDNERTALSLVAAINASASNTIVDAFYVSSYTDNPGRILLQERAVGASGAITATASAHGTAYVPQLPTGGVTISGTAFSYPNRVWCSKQEEPDAVPPLSFYPVGETDDAILRIVQCRDRLYVFKERSLWTISPAGDGNYTVDVFDDSLALLGADTPAVLNNKIHCFTKRGPVSIGDAGVTELGTPVEYDLGSLLGQDSSGSARLPTLRRYSWGCAYASEKIYLLGLSSFSTDTYANQLYCWNAATQVWTMWPIGRTHAIVEPTTDLLYLGATLGATESLWKERKKFNATDYKDQEIAGTQTVSAVGTDANGNTTLTIASASTFIAAGYLIEKSSTIRNIVKSVSGSTVTLQTASVLMGSFTTGTVSVYRPIDVRVRLVAEHMGAPARQKELQGATMHFQEKGFFVASLVTGTDLVGTSPVLKTLTRKSFVSYPLWDTNANTPRNDSAIPQKDTARGNYYNFDFTLSECEAQFKLNGFSFEFDVATERGSR